MDILSPIMSIFTPIMALWVQHTDELTFVLFVIVPFVSLLVLVWFPEHKEEW